jgi:hypothetical protein
VTAVLAIGLDPCFADFSTMPQLTPELVRAYIDAEIARVRELGFDVETRLIAPGEEAEAEIGAALRARSLVHRLAPDVSIVFNSAPTPTWG